MAEILDNLVFQRPKRRSAKNKILQEKTVQQYPNFRGVNGVPQDFIQAYMWFNISSELGDSLSSLFLNQISGKMTPADISQAQAMARAQECDVVYPQVS